MPRQGEEVASVGNICTVVSVLVNDFPVKYHKYYTGDCLRADGRANGRDVSVYLTTSLFLLYFTYSFHA